MPATPDVFVKLFTRRTLTDPADGRTFIDLLSQHVPSWMPCRYGWSTPLRHVYDPGRFDHFWSQLQYHLDWRNEKRTATGEAYTRVGPYATLSTIELKGQQKKQLDPAEVAALAQDCAAPLDLAYGLVHLFDPAEQRDHGGRMFRDIQGEPFLLAEHNRLEDGLPDLAWGNVFGPPYVDLFGGAQRVRSAPAAVVRELGPEVFWLQLTGTLADVRDDRGALTTARAAVRQHLGADCFLGYAGPVRAPRLPRAAEEGLWSPPTGFEPPEDVRAMLQAAASSGKTLPPPSGTIG